MKENEIVAKLSGVVNRWCSTDTDSEDFNVRMSRALLNLAEFEADVNNVQRGKPPLRTDYPIDVVRFNLFDRDSAVLNKLLSQWKDLIKLKENVNNILATRWHTDQQIQSIRVRFSEVSSIFEKISLSLKQLENNLVIVDAPTGSKRANLLKVLAEELNMEITVTKEDTVTLSRMEYTRLIALIKGEYGYDETKILEWIRDTTGTVWTSEDEWTSQELIDDPYG